jgi:hypothetical protein
VGHLRAVLYAVGVFVLAVSPLVVPGFVLTPGGQAPFIAQAQDNNNGGGGGAPPLAPVAAAPANPCLAPGQQASLVQASSTAVVTVFSSPMRVRLQPVDPATVGNPGNRLGDAVFSVTVERCEGGPLAEPVPQINLGFSYTAPADKARLRIAMLQGGQLVDLPTAADPVANYISATIDARSGVFAVVTR